VVPRLAATVMLVRPAGETGEPEVLMLRRSARSAFAPDAYVFPGGTVDAIDRSSRLLARLSGTTPSRLNALFRASVDARLPAEQATLDPNDRKPLLCAALRELFEEGGVLLNAGDAEIEPAALHEARADIAHGRRTFADVLDRLDVALDAGGVELFSHWITPPDEPRRYNTFFFLARANAHVAVADRHETHDELWIAPKAALERYAAGTFAMVYPTIKHVERLAEFRRIDELFHFARSKPVVSIMPARGGSGFALPPALERAW